VSIQNDLDLILQQEDELQFYLFSAETAWEVGNRLRDDAIARGAAMTFEVQIAGRTLFLAQTGFAPADQMEWIRRKRNVVLRFGRSSYAVGLDLQQQGKTIEEKYGLPAAEFATHGGGFPIVLRGTGCVGSVIASGLPQRQDHAMVVDALAAVLAVTVTPLPDVTP
jgi:uncharacterized protein (UPF0303 family)